MIQPYTKKTLNAYRGMIRRCYNTSHEHYKHYGGRGIAVCQRWLDSYDNFFLDMGFPPTRWHSIERTDNNKDYSPENCVWATVEQQANNRRNTLYTLYNNRKMSVAEFADTLILNQKQISSRHKQLTKQVSAYHIMTASQPVWLAEALVGKRPVFK